MRKLNDSRVKIVEEDKKIIYGSRDEDYLKYGTNYAGYVVDLSPKEIVALSLGNSVALNIDDEYVIFLRKGE